ncbi:MAG: hypothetical protein GF317_07895 [Candidatus Lokiarchaeota archaeon]|nr:hypothetical protein [Candidatus Lokiarchaeota archaeon]MBD3199634.1 hypothetical protein [Candidatus Lokiarchaeota archaeon]
MSRNLTRLEGINVGLAKRLREIEISTIEDLANYKPNDLLGKINLELREMKNLISKAEIFLKESSESKIPPDNKMSSGYSMKSTQKIELEENSEENKRI